MKDKHSTKKFDGEISNDNLLVEEDFYYSSFYTCPYCYQKYKSSQLLIKHLEETGCSNKRVECGEEIKKVFSDFEYFALNCSFKKEIYRSVFLDWKVIIKVIMTKI